MLSRHLKAIVRSGTVSLYTTLFSPVFDGKREKNDKKN